MIIKIQMSPRFLYILGVFILLRCCHSMQAIEPSSSKDETTLGLEVLKLAAFEIRSSNQISTRLIYRGVFSEHFQEVPIVCLGVSHVYFSSSTWQGWYVNVGHADRHYFEV